MPKDALHKKYYIKFLVLKVLFAVSFVVLHMYVYKGGDTFLYYLGSTYIADLIIQTPSNFFHYLFGSYENFLSAPFVRSINMTHSFTDTSVLNQAQLGVLISLVSFRSYLTASIVYSLLTAHGIWSIFRVISKMYPKATKHLAFGILYYPTIGIWGSGILKDPLTLASVGWMFIAIYNLVERKKMTQSIILLLIAVLICFKLKPYVLYCFIPAMLLWLQGRMSQKINNSLVKYVVTPILIILLSVGGAFLLQQVSSQAGKYSLDSVQEVAEGFHSWHTYLAENRNQSGYSLGAVDFTAVGILQKTPAALFVTFYRPFPFVDTRNFATFFEAIQSFTLLILTFYIILRVGFLKFLKITFSNADVRAFLLFSIFLGVAVGLTSYNFGALSRYKIPCLPFFTSALIILYHEGIKKKSTIPRKR